MLAVEHTYKPNADNELMAIQLPSVSDYDASIFDKLIKSVLGPVPGSMGILQHGDQSTTTARAECCRLLPVSYLT